MGQTRKEKYMLNVYMKFFYPKSFIKSNFTHVCNSKEILKIALVCNLYIKNFRNFQVLLKYLLILDRFFSAKPTLNSKFYITLNNAFNFEQRLYYVKGSQSRSEV